MQTVSNDQVIQAVFTATPENKSRALAILKGEAEPTSALCAQSSEEAPLLMGMGESAKFLGVSRATLWRMIRDRRLTKVEIYHNAFRLRRSDILALVNRREVKRDKYRFKQLYGLAHGGDMVAKANLWLEFDFAFDHDPLPAFMNPPPLRGGASASASKRTAGVPPATSNPKPPTSNHDTEGGTPC